MNLCSLLSHHPTSALFPRPLRRCFSLEAAAKLQPFFILANLFWSFFSSFSDRFRPVIFTSFLRTFASVGSGCKTTTFLHSHKLFLKKNLKLFANFYNLLFNERSPVRCLSQSGCKTTTFFHSRKPFWKIISRSCYSRFQCLAKELLRSKQPLVKVPCCSKRVQIYVRLNQACKLSAKYF